MVTLGRRSDPSSQERKFQEDWSVIVGSEDLYDIQEVIHTVQMMKIPRDSDPKYEDLSPHPSNQ